MADSELELDPAPDCPACNGGKAVFRLGHVLELGLIKRAIETRHYGEAVRRIETLLLLIETLSVPQELKNEERSESDVANEGCNGDDSSTTRGSGRIQ